MPFRRNKNSGGLARRATPGSSGGFAFLGGAIPRDGTIETRYPRDADTALAKAMRGLARCYRQPDGETREGTTHAVDVTQRGVLQSRERTRSVSREGHSLSVQPEPAGRLWADLAVPQAPRRRDAHRSRKQSGGSEATGSRAPHLLFLATMLRGARGAAPLAIHDGPIRIWIGRRGAPKAPGWTIPPPAPI